MNIDVVAAPVAAQTSPDGTLQDGPAIARVGVIGAGQMGNGISHVCALAGVPVVMLDVKPDALAKALVTMGKNMDRQVHRNLITEDDKTAALARISASTASRAIMTTISSSLAAAIGSDSR